MFDSFFEEHGLQKPHTDPLLHIKSYESVVVVVMVHVDDVMLPGNSTKCIVETTNQMKGKFKTRINDGKIKFL